MVQFDVYGVIHRGQRSRLFALVEEAGGVVPGDFSAITLVRAHLDHVVVELRAHAAAEELLLHPLLDAVAPAVAQRLHDAHGLIDGYLGDLHAVGERVGASASEIDLDSFYRLLAKFTGGYLFHISCEEDEAGSALRSSLEPNELERLQQEFVDAHLASAALAGAHASYVQCATRPKDPGERALVSP